MIFLDTFSGAAADLKRGQRTSEDLGEGTYGLITTAQAEAYADARVREALEQAMTEAAKISNKYGYGYSGHEVDAVDEVIDAIRALIPKGSS